MPQNSLGGSCEQILLRRRLLLSILVIGELVEFAPEATGGRFAAILVDAVRKGLASMQAAFEDFGAEARRSISHWGTRSAR